MDGLVPRMGLSQERVCRVSVALPIANVRAQGFGLEDRGPHTHMLFPRYPTILPSRFVRVVSRSHEARLGPHGRTKHISEQAQWACPKSRPVPRVAQDHRRSGMSLWWVLHLVVCVQAWRRCSRAREASPPHVGCHSPKEPGARARGLDATQMVSGTPCAT